MSFFRELKRRNVVKVGLAYLVFAWLILQVADVLLGNLSAPDWAFEAVLLALVIGLPIVLFVSWVFEWTPDGLKRDDGQRTESAADARGGSLYIVVGAALAAALVYIMIDRMPGDRAAGPGSVQVGKSIAVLPFRNRSNVADDVHFVDGIHDDILTQLAKLSSLEKVISRTSTEQYRGTDKPIPQIAAELGVATVLEGGVQRAGDRVRINVQLIDAIADQQLWADSYDRELTVENLFAIQSEITREIYDALQLLLSDEESDRINFVPTSSLDAYNAFVLGREQLGLRTATSLANAEAHFQRAIDLDPNFSLAYTGLAETLSLLPEHAGVEYLTTVERRQNAIDKALELDPLSGEAYNALALLRLNQFRLQEDGFETVTNEEVDSLFQKAIELVPNYPLARTWYAAYLGMADRSEEAIPHQRKAVELDPDSPVHRDVLAENLLRIGRLEEAQVVAREGIARNPNYHAFYERIGDSYRQVGNLGEAQRWFNRGTELSRTHRGLRYGECRGYVRLRAFDDAEECFAAAERDFPDDPAIFYSKFEYLWARGELEELMEAGERLETHPAFDSDRRILQILLRIYGSTRRLDRASEMLRAVVPHLFAEGEIQTTPSLFELHVFAAFVMFHDGETARANYLLDQVLDATRSMHRMRGVGYGTLDVAAHVMRGEKQAAINALREALDAGWRSNYWPLRSYVYDSMRDEPEWNALIEQLEADVDRQREWYEAHREEPVLPIAGR